MSVFTQQVLSIEYAYNKKVELEDKIKKLERQLDDYNNQYSVMLEAQKLLSTVSDDNTKAVLDYITGIINKALAELFPYDARRVFLEKKLFSGQHAHINVKLENSKGKPRDLTLGSGTGLRQVISFLFVVSLIEIRKSRRILLMDELLSGLHPEAKRIIVDLMKIFSEEGFQFVMVEYGVDDFGRIYLVEKPDTTAKVTPLDGKYSNEVFIFNNPEVSFDSDVNEDDGE